MTEPMKAELLSEWTGSTERREADFKFEPAARADEPREALTPQGRLDWLDTRTAALLQENRQLRDELARLGLRLTELEVLPGEVERLSVEVDRLSHMLEVYESGEVPSTRFEPPEALSDETTFRDLLRDGILGVWKDRSEDEKEQFRERAFTWRKRRP